MRWGEMEAQRTNVDVLKEATRKPFLRPGNKVLRVVKAEKVDTPVELEDGTQLEEGGRAVARLSVVADGEQGFVNLKISPEPYKEYFDDPEDRDSRHVCKKGHEQFNPRNKFDGKYEKWVRFENILNPLGEGHLTIDQVMTQIAELQFNGYVGIAFDPVGGGDRVFVRKDEVDEYIKNMDYQPVNYLKTDSIRA